MNICIITSSFPSRPDDIVQAPFLIDFIGGLKKGGHQVFLFTQDRQGVKEEFLEGVHVKWFPWMKSKRPLVQLNPTNPLDCLRIGSLLHKGQKELLPFVKENRIDACLALWVLPSGYFADRAYRQTGIPYSVWALGSDIYRYGRNPFLYPVMKRIIGEARGVFADGFDLSKRVEERFGRKCFFLATTRTILPPSPSLKGGWEGLRNIPYRFLFVGRLEKVKGIDVLLQSMALMTEEDMDIHLTIVGKGRMEEWAKVFVRQKGLGKRVSMVGNVSDPALASLYAFANCVVIPSRSESIPLVFSEAIRFDKELIVTDVGDMGMMGRQYGVAWVIPPEDPIALKEMMKGRAEARRDDRAGREIEKREELKRLFDIETSVERFLADYL
jgi:glycosyltransferase involved in cell wall biosynthesis